MKSIMFRFIGWKAYFDVGTKAEEKQNIAINHRLAGLGKNQK
ncbi:hypothetical protein OH456_12490 [Vibrio sp. La 4.2.2]|nr:hypothetical protein [Vibrio sp. La 4.2.2]MDA0108979.1 hypothetical protein [Vibrio sp. La 4.2.2]